MRLFPKQLGNYEGGKMKFVKLNREGHDSYVNLEYVKSITLEEGVDGMYSWEFLVDKVIDEAWVDEEDFPSRKQMHIRGNFHSEFYYSPFFTNPDTASQWLKSVINIKEE